jgi:hypothetical protein
VSIQHSGNKVIGANSREDGHSLNQCFSRVILVFSAPPTMQAQFCMQASSPMNHQDNFACGVVDVGDNFVNESSHNPLLQTHVRVGIVPNRFKLFGQIHKFLCRGCGNYRGLIEVLLNSSFNLAHALQRLIPSSLQLTGNQAVFGIGAIVLSLRSLGGIACRFEIAPERFQYVIATVSFLLAGQHRRLYCFGLHDLQDLFSNSFRPQLFPKSDTTWFAVVQPASIAGVT